MALILGTDTMCLTPVANAYHAALPFNAGWMALEEVARQEPLLRLSSRLISQGFDWGGWPSVTGQTFAFPRVGLYHPNGGLLDNTTIPLLMQHMTAEMAFQLDSRNRTRNLALADLDIRAAAGTLFGGGARRQVFPDVVLDMLPPGWGWLRNSGAAVVVPAAPY